MGGGRSKVASSKGIGGMVLSGRGGVIGRSIVVVVILGFVVVAAVVSVVGRLVHVWSFTLILSCGV